MTFNALLEKYYLPKQQSEIIFILNELFICKEIEVSLNDFYESAAIDNKQEIISQFVLTISEFTTAINKGLRSIKSQKKKARIEFKIAELGIYLIRDTYQFSKLGQIEYFNLLKATLKKTYAKNSWNFSVLDSLLTIDNLQIYSIEQKAKDRKKTIKLSKPIQLEWYSDIPLDLFIDSIASTFRGIKSKKTLYKLFDKIETDFKIILPSKFLHHFLTLFYELHECRIIRVVGNRGLFVYLKQHLEPPTKDKYPQREFRKIRHEAIQNENEKKEIFKIIKPMLDKYINEGQ